MWKTTMVRDRVHVRDNIGCDFCCKLHKTKHRETNNILGCRLRPGSGGYRQKKFDAGQGCTTPCPYPMIRSRPRLVDVNVRFLPDFSKWKGLGNVNKHKEKVKKMDSGSRKTISNFFSYQTNTGHTSRVDYSTLVCSLSSHRHSFIDFVFSSRFNDS